MEKPKIPDNENERQAALDNFNILDTPPEESFDDLTLIASQICQTPIALVSLIDRDRNWFKSKYGVDEPYESPRDISFCGHAINTPSELFEVRDARLDDRFFDNPLVTGQLGLNFYSGVPLLDANNFPLGTLCVFDTKPKILTDDQKKALRALGKEVINRLILRNENLKISKELEIVNQKYFRLYDNAPDMMLSIDPNSKKIIDCNNTLCLKLGYTRKEIIGQELFFLYHADYHEKAKLTLIEFKEKGEIVDNRLVIRTKSNKKIHVSLNENSIKDKKGNIIQSNSIFRDITELIKVETALLETNQQLELKVENRTQELKFSNERLELALRGANDGIFDWIDFDSETQWWSPNYYRLLGYEPDEIKSTTTVFSNQLVHPDDLDRIWKSFYKCIEENVPMNDEYRLKTKSEGYKWFRGKANVLKDSNGKAFRIAGSISDIQQRKSLEIKLKEAQNFLSKVTEIAPSVIYVVNHKTRLNDFSNKELGSVLGYSNEEIEKMGIHLFQKLCHPDDLQAANNHFTSIQSLKQDEKISIEYRLRHKKGNYIWFHSVDTIFEKSTKGKVIKHIGVATDITSIKESEENLIIQKEILEEQNNDLKQFTYIATHDLKSPILTVQGHFKFLKTQFKNPNKDSQESIEMIDEELNKFNNTIQALAEAIKLREKKIKTVKIDLNKTFQNLMPYYQNEVKSLNGQISINLAKHSTVLGTPIYIKSIIQNLISNAIKYRSENRNISINITTKEQDNYILLTIEDNGLGIDLKLHEHRLFKMFNQFHDHSKGSGMGLFMVNYMVNKINGKLNLESKVEVGTKFSILLEKAK
jgi:PAS domain S-box-containing protein